MDNDYQSSLGSILQHLLATKVLLDQVGDHPIDSCLESLTAAEAAKLQVSLAYTLASIFYVLIKVSGSDTVADRDISSEINRIKQYVLKLNNTERKTTVNVQATKRTIAHHLS